MVMVGMLQKLEPAATVLRLMGVRALARTLGVSAGYVGQWQMEGWRGGTDGRVPMGQRSAILTLARKRGHDQITEEFISQEKEFEVGKFSRDKGARYEVKITNILKAAGFDALKIPLSGAAQGYPGDIEIRHDVFGRLLCQNKCYKDNAGYKTLNKLLRDVTVLYFKELDLVAMDWHHWMSLINGDRVQPVTIPIVKIRKTVIEKAIDGHEVLFFQLNRQPDRVVMTWATYGHLCDLQPLIGRSEPVVAAPKSRAS